MKNRSFGQKYTKFFVTGSIFFLILLTGTAGYWYLSDGRESILNCLYMTIITISTIGFTEVIDLSNNPAGRIYTIFIAIGGIGTLTYFISNFTAFIVEGEIKKTFRRKRMERLSQKMEDHLIICGIGRVGINIINELEQTSKKFLCIENDREVINEMEERYPKLVVLEGDATENDTLITAGIPKAFGIFAVTGDDSSNLVISLSAKQLNPIIRVVASCKLTGNISKVEKAGADSVILPTKIGALRLVSEMLRPTVVNFLDIMLRDKDKNLRVEEISLPSAFWGKPLNAIELSKYPHTLILAIKTHEDWIYNPPRTMIVSPENTIIIMTTPAERAKLEKVIREN